MAKKPHYKEIIVKKERQASGVMFRELGKDELCLEEEKAILRIPLKAAAGFDPTLFIPSSWTSMSLEELKQITIWVEQGRPPLSCATHPPYDEKTKKVKSSA